MKNILICILVLMSFICNAYPINSSLSNRSTAIDIDESIPYDAEVEYLESTGSQWIGIGETFHKNIYLQLSLTYTRLTYYGWGLNANNYEVLWITGGYVYFGNGKNALASPVSNIEYDFELDFTSGNMVMQINNDVVRRTSGTQPNYGQIYLFALNNKGAINPIRVRHSYFLMWDEGILMHYLIPVRFTNEDGEAEGAMYDRRTGHLYRNQGSDQFVIGPDKEVE